MHIELEEHATAESRTLVQRYALMTSVHYNVWETKAAHC